MCGLAGFISARALSSDAATIRLAAMTDELVNRGPDGSGSWVGDGVALGHRRLAVLDLSEAGRQPMTSGCGRYIAVVNGEIYNHRELRRELVMVGSAAAWRGTGDTETLVAAIAHWGFDEALRRCRGMFALAVWDRLTGTLLLARDRMGEKPLYWGWAGETFVFASETKAIAAHPEFDAVICRSAVQQYLRFGYIPAPRSIFGNLFKLEPGVVLAVEGRPPITAPLMPLRPGDRYDTISLRRYWSVADTVAAGAHEPFRDEGAAVLAVEQALAAAVSRQTLADVPLGTFLSGGIDSSAIVALLQDQRASPISTFAVGFDEPRYDEAPFAAAVARHLGTNHCELRVTARDALDVIPGLPAIYDEPFADSSQIPTFLICRAARAQVTVALTGDGGDEMFGGYNRYLYGPRAWRTLSRLPFRLRKAMGSGIDAMPQGFWHGMDRLSGKYGGPRLSQVGETLASSLKSIRHQDDLHLFLVSQCQNPSALLMEPREEALTLLDDPRPAILSTQCLGSSMMAQDMLLYLPDDILCKVDRAAMSVGLETRAPFLDLQVIEVAAQLPSAMRFRGSKGKWVLRQILAKHVPVQLFDRPKMGFSVPVGEWLRGPLREWAEELLSVAVLSQHGLLRPEPILIMWAEHKLGRRDWSKQLWTILMLQAWIEAFRTSRAA